MTNANDSAPSIVEAYHQAWTRGDVDQALTYVSPDVRCYAPDENATTKDDWRDYRLGYVSRQQQPA